MTTTDDVRVRELADRLDHLTPPMSLDPADVLRSARRRHRRATGARRTLAGLAVVGVGVGALQVTGSDLLARVAGDPSVGPVQTVTVGDLRIGSAIGTTPIQTEAGLVHDLGIPVDPAEPDGARYVLEHVVIDPATVETDALPRVAVESSTADRVEVEAEIEHLVLEYLAVRTYDPATGTVGDRLLHAWGTEDDGPGPDGTEHAGTLITLGVADTEADPELYVDGEVARVWLPTFRVPDVPGRVFFARITSDTDRESWPGLSVYARDAVRSQVN